MSRSIGLPRRQPRMLRPKLLSATYLMVALGLIASIPSTLFVVLVRPCYAWTSSLLVTGANGYVGRALVHELLLRASRREQSPHEMMIFCLVRPQRIESEIAYWDQWHHHRQHDNDDDDFQIQDNSVKNTGRASIRVLPYDMLDGGVSFKAALQAASEAASTTTTVDNSDDDDKNMLCVFHIASVFGPTDNHEQTALDNVRGTEDLIETLATAAKGKNNNKVLNCKLILTSSMAAVRGTGQEPLNGKYYTCSDWNTVSQLGSNWGSSYQWSKTESERRAWALCHQHDIPMVSLCPSFVFGPPSSLSLDGADAASSSYSLTLVGQWARGESPVQSRLFVDVRDVARAHVEAAFRPEAIGQRYIVSTEKRVPSSTIASWIQELLLCSPSEGAAAADLIQYDADFTGGSIAIGEQEVEAVERLQKELGVTLREVKSTITEMAQMLLTRA